MPGVDATATAGCSGWPSRPATPRTACSTPTSPPPPTTGWSASRSAAPRTRCSPASRAVRSTTAAGCCSAPRRALLGTGDAGDPALAADPRRWPARCWRSTSSVSRWAPAPVFSRGHRNVTALCLGGEQLYATDEGLTGEDEFDAVYRGWELRRRRHRPGDRGAGRGRWPGRCAVSGPFVFLGEIDGRQVQVGAARRVRRPGRRPRAVPARPVRPAAHGGARRPGRAVDHHVRPGRDRHTRGGRRRVLRVVPPLRRDSPLRDHRCLGSAVHRVNRWTTWSGGSIGLSGVELALGVPAGPGAAERLPGRLVAHRDGHQHVLGVRVVGEAAGDRGRDHRRARPRPRPPAPRPGSRCSAPRVGPGDRDSSTGTAARRRSVDLHHADGSPSCTPR